VLCADFNMKNRNRIKTGETVEICSESEIAATLDEHGMLDGLPFMPEMRKYCGVSFRVLTPAKKVVVEGTGYRLFNDIVLLDGAVCDGKSHNGCQRLCNILWKTAWLKKTNGRSPESTHVGKQQISKNELLNYAILCQSANLKIAESRIPVSVEDLVRSYLCNQRLKKYWFFKKAGSLVLFLLLKIKGFFRRGYSIAGPLAKTPDGVLNLKAGDTVKVKTMDEILATLDRAGKNRGLGFTPEMTKYCGDKLSVLRPVTRIIDEESGESRTMSNTVMLRNVRCDGKYHTKCPRRCYLLWREIWLSRA